MLSYLKNNKLSRNPTSISDALNWRLKIEQELHNIDRQLADPTRKDRPEYSGSKYEEWVKSALRAQKRFALVAQLLEAWMDRADRLLNESYELLKSLEIDLEDGFDEGESELMQRLDEHFQGSKVQGVVEGNRGVQG